MRSLFDYVDYRVYLADFYRYRKATVPGFSHRVFLREAGLSGPNFLKNVIDGKKNLSLDSIGGFSKALGLKKKEADFFQLLVLHNQAKTPAEKQEYFLRMAEFSDRSETQKLHADHFEYLSNWFNVAIREYIHAHPFSGDYHSLAKAIEPSITPGQAKKSVELLLGLGLIKMDSDGLYRVAHPILTTGPLLNSLAARSLHRSMMEIASSAMDTTPAESHYFRTIIGSFSDEAVGRIKLELEGARKRILEIVATDRGGPRRVGSIGLQQFPLERIPKKKDSL